MTTSDSGFCPQCGEAKGTGDAFCRACGASLTEPTDQFSSSAGAAPESLAETAPEQESWLTKRRALWGVLAVFILVAAAGVAVALIVNGGESETKPKLSPSAVARKQYGRAFAALMADRDRFFTLERDVLAPIAQADQKMFAYVASMKNYEDESERIRNAYASAYEICRQFYDVPCPNPTYPDPPVGPDLAGETLLLRKAAADLRQLSAELAGRRVPPALDALHTQFKTATDLLATQADFDADVLTKTSHTYDEQGGGASIDEQEFATMKRDTAVPAIQQMNQEALTILKRLGMDPREYDVPGGRDIDPSDHSTTLAGSETPPST